MEMLPEPRLRRVDNQTGLSVMQYDKMAPGRKFCDVVVVKASFDLTPDGLMAAPAPGKLCLADRARHSDNPLGSSLAEAGDLILGKPGADIVLTGSLRSLSPQLHWPVHVAVIDEAQGMTLADYRCVVTGPRRWQHSRKEGWHLGEAGLTDAVPAEYELAWGGRRADLETPADQWDSHSDNPSGSGFSFDGYSVEDQPRGPQWISHAGFHDIASISQELTGLGPIARFWRSRSSFGGTYDTAWREQFDAGRPDYPSDFDLHFFQCAHPALQTAAGLRGDECLSLQGVLQSADAVRVPLPGWTIEAVLGNVRFNLPLDTVHLDLDDSRMDLVWHLVLPQALGIERVQLNSRRV
jgi:hypothetical protein